MSTRTWRKQLLVAKEARRVDVLCFRVSLSHKILRETEKYKELLNIVKSCVKALEDEVGALDSAAKKMDRRIVNRLSCGTEVQKLCSHAVEVFDSMPINQWPSKNCSFLSTLAACRIHFKESHPNAVTVVLEYQNRLFKKFLGCRLWHRKSTATEYSEEATSIVLMPGKAFKLSNLDPSTEYMCKVSFFSDTEVLGPYEAKWVTPMPSESSLSLSNNKPGQVEITGADPTQLHSMSTGESKTEVICNLGKNRSLDSINETKNYGVPSQENSSTSPKLNPPLTPFASDKEHCPGWRKQVKESDYEHSVRVVRRLEHEGYLNKEFRVKFLTWFSLKATTQERRVISVFVDTMIEDPSSLAGQLIDSFSDKIYGGQNVGSHHGFCCSKLWH